jgi:DNA mismatch repair protein MutS2
LNERALAILEFPKVLQRLAASCSFAASRQLALDLKPSPGYGEVVRRQRLTAEGRRLHEIKPNLALGQARDIRGHAAQAALGHALQPEELLELAGTLSLAQTAHSTITRLRDQLPLLAEMADGIEDFGSLVADIQRCISPRAEVTDAASPMLAQLRRHVRQAHDRLLNQLQSLIGSTSGRNAVQEPIVTLRDGRYVIPVKAEMRGQVPGIVHDVSASGATVFLEPLAVVELGNSWRELQLEEQREVERILRELSLQVGDYAREIEAAVQALAEIDLALAKARLGESFGALDLPEPGEEQSWITPDAERLRLVNARHPLLSGDVVPISLHLGRGEAGESTFTVLLITGPNTGGKTVALKTVGLLALMAQAGLPIPADRGSCLPVFEDVFADIGDEQSIEQSLSTFSAHMTNVIGILARATPRSLVLLDELTAGTDPTEGAALAKAILQHLLAIGCLTVATTHHGELKAFAHNTPGVINASVEFDPETLSPTYRLNIGLPGHSNALAIARRLGLPDPILDAAQESLGEEHLEVETLIRDLQRERDRLEAERAAEEHQRSSEEEQRREAERRLAELEAQQQRAAEQAGRQLQREAEQARKRLLDAGKTIERALEGPPSRRKQRSLEHARSLVRSVEAGAERLQTEPRKRPATLPPLAVGDRVWLRGVSEPGEVLALPDEQGQVQVALGTLRATVSLRDIEQAEKRPRRQSIAGPRLAPSGPRTVPEVHVRGLTVDEALHIVDQKLDEAVRAGASEVRVVHGKGTGTLRRAVRQLFDKHPLVHGYVFADPREGGEGVTVVELVR